MTLRVTQESAQTAGGCNFCNGPAYRTVHVVRSEDGGIATRLCPVCAETLRSYLTRVGARPRGLEASAFTDAVLLMVHNGLNVAQSTASVAFGPDHPSVGLLRSLSQVVLAVNQGTWSTARSQLDALISDARASRNDPA